VPPKAHSPQHSRATTRADLTWSKAPVTQGSILRQNVNLAKLFLNLLDTLGAERVRMTVLPACYVPPSVFTRYDRNGNGRCAVAKRPQLFRENPNQISARNLGFSHAPPPGVQFKTITCGCLSRFQIAAQKNGQDDSESLHQLIE
jgi:hypothetical protein